MKIYCIQYGNTYDLELISNGVDCTQDIISGDDTIRYNPETERYETESYDSIEWWAEYESLYDFVEEYVADNYMPDEYYTVNDPDLMTDIVAKAEWIRNHEDRYWVIDERVDSTWGDDHSYSTEADARRSGDSDWEHLTEREQKSRIGFAIYKSNMDNDGCIDLETAVKVYDYKEEK